MLLSLIVDFTDFLSLWLGLRRLIAILRAVLDEVSRGEMAKANAKTFRLSVAVYTDAYMNM